MLLTSAGLCSLTRLWELRVIDSKAQVLLSQGVYNLEREDKQREKLDYRSVWLTQQH